LKDMSAPDPARIAFDQRILVVAMAIDFGTLLLMFANSPLYGVLKGIAILVSILGVTRMASALHGSVPVMLASVVVLFLPFPLSTAVLLAFNISAMNALNAAGWNSGFLVSRRPRPGPDS